MARVEPLLDTPSLSLGRFRCPPGDERWQRENWIGDEPHVVFPFRPVGIEQLGREPLVASPTHAVLYDPDQVYRRELLSPDGDVAIFVALKAPLAAELVAARHLGSRAGGEARFGAPEVALEPATLLRVQLLARDLGASMADPLDAEEVAVQVVARLARAAMAAPHGTTTWQRAPGGSHRILASRATTSRAHAALAADTKRAIAADPGATTTLAHLGDRLGASPFHLARVFRSVTGLSVGSYRERLRLGLALDRLLDASPAPASITRVAVDLGFASHAHFDDRFRRAFGCAPSALRAASASELRTIAKAAARLAS